MQNQINIICYSNSTPQFTLYTLSLLANITNHTALYWQILAIHYNRPRGHAGVESNGFLLYNSLVEDATHVEEFWEGRDSSLPDFIKFISSLKLFPDYWDFLDFPPTQFLVCWVDQHHQGVIRLFNNHSFRSPT
jgi:hypothetical protein